jgi:hypothetical protein
MRLFPVIVMMPILQITWLLFAMASGMVYYQVRRPWCPP